MANLLQLVLVILAQLGHGAAQRTAHIFQLELGLHHLIRLLLAQGGQLVLHRLRLHLGQGFCFGGKGRDFQRGLPRPVRLIQPPQGLPQPERQSAQSQQIGQTQKS